MLTLSSLKQPNTPTQFRQSSAPPSLKTKKAGQPISNDLLGTQSRVNGYTSRSSESAPIARSSTSNPAYLDTLHSPALHRNDSIMSSKKDGDSLLDLYGNGKGSGVNGLKAELRGNQNGGVPGDDDSKWIDRDKLLRIEGQDQESSNWIDSDKLAQIESKEMAQAGIRIPPKGNRNSFKTLQNLNSEQKPQKVQQVDEDDRDDEKLHNPNEPSNDLRHPSEQALDHVPNPSQTRLSLRNGSSSKIPLSVSSPAPVRQHFIERTVPLIRHPHSPDSGSDDELSVSYPRTRKRSYSASSAVIQNAESESNSTSTTTKPTRNARAQSHTAALAPPGRKNSSKRTINMNLAKNRSRSNPQLINIPRPGTSASSHPSRDSGSLPGSAGKSQHAPEGPPPWSLSTYSPDPKLPPEKQLIPTVAKRLQQEQWEKEGAFATVYDSRLRPLKVEEDIDPGKGMEYQKEGENKGREWPLKTPPETGSSTSGVKQDNRRQSKVQSVSDSPFWIWIDILTYRLRSHLLHQ